MKDNWKEYYLTDIAEYYNGMAFKPIHWKKEGVPIIRIEQITRPDTANWDFYQGNFSKKNEINYGDVIFSWSATLKVVVWKGEKAVLNQHLFKVEEKNGFDKYYVAYLIDFNLGKLADESQGSTMKHVTRKSLGKFVVTLPPLPQQKKIAKILSTVDSVIEKTESAIAKYQAIKQGLMHDLFTRGIDVNTGKLRPTPQEAPDLYKESVLGLIPRDWEEGFILEVVEENSPVTYGIVQPGEYSQKGVLLIRGKDYISGWAQESEFFKVKKELHNQFKRSTTVSGDILICIVGATYGAVGVVPEWIKEANITQTTARIRCNQKKFSPHFIEYYLKSSFGRLMIEKYVKGSAQPGLNLADVEKFITLYPKNINEQKLIGERIRTLDKKIKTEQQALAKYQQLKAGLLQDLLTGKVEVSVD